VLFLVLHTFFGLHTERKIQSPLADDDLWAEYMRIGVFETRPGGRREDEVGSEIENHESSWLDSNYGSILIDHTLFALSNVSAGKSHVR
jgi:hypothetical protein